ncbi:uncharacterized protein MKZ38_007009 [Zalerion maritima]|uniref:SH3 domain-containing protein n=1 Tax=Zalerion maritima TaxID=339359 RepID=A0AAD5WQ14_9PEZI|nr:uncharacterized protein MKZ38_007009 [Zalerion maritima]
MENSRMYGGGRKAFDMGNILGDPFALATISIAALGWIIAFIPSIIAQVGATADNKFPPYNWWAIVLALFLISGVAAVIGFDSISNYSVAITGYTAVALVLTTSAVNNLIYQSLPAREAAASGHLLLSMVFAIWILYFGSTPSATPHAYIDSFALQKDSHLNRQTVNFGGGRPETSTSVQPPQMYTTSAQLNGLENPSPIAGVSQQRNSFLNPGFGSQKPAAPAPVPSNGAPNGPNPGQPEGEIVPPTEYPYRAKAIYSYEANPDDANEISFSKHEILEVSDVSGRWWQARKDGGETGIAPSNYLILL